MFPQNPSSNNRPDSKEKRFYPKTRRITWMQRLQDYIRQDETGAHCHIVGDSVCQYVQKKIRIDNFLRHFRDLHEHEAREKGLLEDDGDEAEEPIEEETCPQEVASDPMVELRSQVLNFDIFNTDGRRKDWYNKLVRPWVLEDENGAHCRIADDSVCGYTQKTLRLQNFLRHFRSIHETEARAKGLFWDVYKDYLESNVQEVKQKIQNEYQDFKTKPNKWYEVLKPYLLEDQRGIHCQVVVGDSVCKYTQKMFRVHNMLRHFRVMHKQESKQMGILWEDSEPSDADQSVNIDGEQLDEEIESMKIEVSDSQLQDSWLGEGPSDQDTLMHHSDFIPDDQVSANKSSSLLSNKPKSKLGGRKTLRVMKFILQDEAGAHCRIRDDLPCPYTQKMLRVHNFLRHFRQTHPIEAKQNGLFWRSNKNRNAEERPDESFAQESDDDRQRGEEVCVKTETFNVVDRGLAQVDDEGVRCVIEPDSLCEYRQESYDEVRFLAHFRLKHSYLEDVLFPGDGATIPDQVDHVAVGEDGIFCQMEPDSGCDYFQASYNEKKFRQHFREKHSNRDEKQEGLENNLHQKLMRYIYEDDLGFHCHISGDAECDFVQQERQLLPFLRHFLLSHRKQAKQEGLLSKLQPELLKSVLPTDYTKIRIVLYQSYHLKRQGLVLIREDGYCCSQELCDFVREKYDESVFLEHLRQNHPTLYEDLMPSEQPLTQKVSEHVLENESGFHCQIAGPGVCNYVQRRFRMQNFYRHIYLLHREDFDRAGFVLRHVNSYGVAKAQDLQASSGQEESHIDGEPRVAESSNSNCDTLLDLELSVNQASSDEERVSRRGRQNQPDSVQRVKKRKWWAQRAKIEELIKVNDEGAFCCNINEQTGCSFDMSKCFHQLFAKHFRTKHPEEAKRHGFFDEFFLRRQDNSQFDTTMVGELVALDDRGGFRCNINPKSNCIFVRQRLEEALFLKHFRTIHPEEAKRHRFVTLTVAAGAYSRMRHSNGKRKKFFIHMVRENVMADSRGIHCRIADPLCDYVQEIFRPQNFQRHFIVKHPADARVKGFLKLEPEPKRMKVEQESADEPDDEVMANPAEYCRLCSNSAQPLEPIFKHPENVENTLVTLIEQFTGITVTFESDSSAHICEKCHQQLKNSQRFRELCQSFDRKVRRRIAADQPAPECFSPPPVVPFNLDVVPVAEQTLIPLESIKPEVTDGETMDLDPLVSGDTEPDDELPYSTVLNNTLM